MLVVLADPGAVLSVKIEHINQCKVSRAKLDGTKFPFFLKVQFLNEHKQRTYKASQGSLHTIVVLNRQFTHAHHTNTCTFQNLGQKQLDVSVWRARAILTATAEAS